MTKGVNREIVRVMQAIFAGDAPWPDIPDAETALQNQVAYLTGRGVQLHACSVGR
jgi:hypothetical protein